LITHIIFDLGGIFLNIDYQKTENAFLDLGVSRFPEMFSQQTANDLFIQLETGRIPETDFYAAFRSESGLPWLTNTDIRDAWNAMLLDFPGERLQWLSMIREKYNVYLFSNTNAIHYKAFMEIMETAHPGTDFNGFFRKAYYSHELGQRKPDLHAFEAILAEQQLDPSHTLFIDDTLKNIEAARKTGMQTIHLQAPQTLLDLDL